MMELLMLPVWLLGGFTALLVVSVLALLILGSIAQFADWMVKRNDTK